MFDTEVDIPNFCLDEAEMAAVLRFIINLFTLPDNTIESFQFVKNKLDVPLVYRISNLLSTVPQFASDWKRWLSDQDVNEKGLKHLYFIVALLNSFKIKCPIDISSSLLGGKKDADIQEVFRRDKIQSMLVNLSDYGDEYPNQYLTIPKNILNRYYIRYDKDTINKAKFFLSELERSIKSGQAENSHAYLYRKIYRSKLALSHLSPVKREIVAWEKDVLFEKLLSSPHLSEENKQKTLLEYANYYLHQYRSDLAQPILLQVTNKNQDIVRFAQAKLQFQLGNISACLDLLSKIDTNISTNYEVRLQCYSNMEWVDEGIKYYLKSFTENLNEFSNCILLLKWLSDREEFSTAEKYYLQMESFFSVRDGLVFEYAVLLNSMIAFYRDWARTRLNSSLPAGYKISTYFDEEFFSDTKDELLEKAFALIGKLKAIDSSNYKILVTEAYLFLSVRNNEAAQTICDQILEQYPINSPARRLKALILLYRNGDEQTKAKDYENAIQLLKANIEVFDKFRQSFETESPTYMTLARVYLKQSRYQKGIDLLEKIIDRHDKNRVKRPKLYNKVLSLLSYLRFKNENPDAD